MTNDTIIVQSRIDKALDEKLRKYCERKERTISGAIRFILSSALKNEIIERPELDATIYNNLNEEKDQGEAISN